MDSFTVQTRQRDEMIDITDRIRASLERTAMRQGFGMILLMHTTAGLTINDHRDPAVAHDILLGLDRMVPRVQDGFQHKDGDSAAHIKSSLMGSGLRVLVEDGALALGHWQGIFLCEFDGPRQRSVKVAWMALSGEDRQGML
jgi:secondary thiamine-phosphate synthase enzyme